ncbi:hypothetical protein CEE37_14005 [candidate division LCP-89 bacterium B3_LCP]|uniref:Fibronectin type-III domain-containing protein n=1 Tax=candidate division LCP-89 bacterium B3_LCP TaxID=2012998 RepID=A0A532URQ6_UNCL8|nr:MAG: hypothetical protein CEE37_14005 [candidate division LCP-89 bacterium B3_LCP]
MRCWGKHLMEREAFNERDLNHNFLNSERLSFYDTGNALRHVVMNSYAIFCNPLTFDSFLFILYAVGCLEFPIHKNKTEETHKFKGEIMNSTKCSIFAVIALLSLSMSLSAAQMTPPPMTDDLEWMGRIVVEFTEDLGSFQVNDESGVAMLGNTSLDALAQKFGIYRMEKLIPWSEKPDDPSIRDVSRYYILEFPVEIDLHKVISAYESNVKIITAEPYRIHKADYTPNDTYFGNQWALAQVNAEIAYDFCQGSDEVVVGIVDSGIDTAHVDLRDNLWVNPGEDLNGNGIIDPIEWNGIDDDLNGFIDDFWGWNVWWNNNDVQDPLSAGHGTACAGCASAVTDNGIGIASLGWSAKLQTARAGDGTYIYSGIQGISYCGYNGSDIVSCSWGGSYYSGYEQSVINGLWGNGVIVVASAGNENSQGAHYPSFYNNVVSVAATDQYDQKAYFSNYSSTVDVCAPGMSIMTTNVGGAYQTAQGTSFSCPIVSGLCALVWAADPSLTNAQVCQQIYDTCVDIYPQNPGYIGLLGYGRIDAGAAISTLYPNLGYTEQTFDDAAGGNGNGRPEAGETVDLLLTIENSSSTVNAIGVSVSAICNDQDITLTSTTSSFGNIAASGSANNYGDPITFEVDAGAEPHEVTFELTLTEEGMGLVQIEELTQMIGFPDIVIVDDDGGDSYETWYEFDLTGLGYVYEVWEVETQGDIPSATLQGYPTAVWHTSNAADPLSTAEQTAIEDYLNGNGQLFITGEDIDEQVAGTNFYSDVLYSSSLSSAGFFTLDGVPGDPISDGTDLILVGAGGAGNSLSPSEIEPVGDAETVYTYTTSSNAGGIRWNDTNAKLVYFAFNFEAISGINSTPRDTVLANILDWFDMGAPPPPPPPAPTLIAPSNGATGVEYDPTEFSWNASVGATSYHIQVATDAGFTSIVYEDNVSSTSTSEGLDPDTEYFWHVNASNAGGTSDYSSTWSFTTMASSAPAMIVELTYISGSPISAGGGTLYYAIWGENQGGVPLDYDIWIDKIYESSDTTTLILREITNYQPGWQINRPDAWFPVPSDWPGGNYEFRIYSGWHPEYDVWHTDAFSWVKSGAVDLGYDFEANLPLNAPDPFAEIMSDVEYSIPESFDVVGVYPNPFNPETVITYQLPESVLIELSVFDISGRLVTELVNGWRDAGSHEVTFDATGLVSGIYIYRLNAGDYTTSGKMVLMK